MFMFDVLSLKHICLTKYSNTTELSKNLKVMWSLNSPMVTISISLPSICFHQYASINMLLAKLHIVLCIVSKCQPKLLLSILPPLPTYFFLFFFFLNISYFQKNKTKTHLRQRVAVHEHTGKKEKSFA